MNYLVLLRHGQSEWNLANKFTGFKDVDLTEKGEEEAKNADPNIQIQKVKRKKKNCSSNQFRSNSHGVYRRYE